MYYAGLMMSCYYYYVYYVLSIATCYLLLLRVSTTTRFATSTTRLTGRQQCWPYNRGGWEKVRVPFATEWPDQSGVRGAHWEWRGRTLARVVWRIGRVGAAGYGRGRGGVK